MRIYCAALVLLLAGCAFAQTGDDAVRNAIERGRNSTTKRIWEQVKKRSQCRINRAGLDPVEKKITFLSFDDRIALESSETARQMRELTVDQVRAGITPGTEILLESNCYNSTYAGSLPKWGPSGGVHMVVVIDGRTVQPIAAAPGAPDSVALFPQDHGILLRQGSQISYIPLYHSAVYERASERTWFMFPEIQHGQQLTVIVISGQGNRKEKQVRLE